MRKRFFYLLPILILTCNSFAQVNYSYTTTRGLSLADSSDTFYLYLPEPKWPLLVNHQGVKENTTSSIKQTVASLSRLTITGYIDSSRAATTIDSLFGRARMLDIDKIPFGDYYYFDFTNNDSAGAVVYLEDQVPYNRVASTSLTSPNFWLDLSDVFKLCHGLEIETVARFAGAADSFRVKYNIDLGFPR